MRSVPGFGNSVTGGPAPVTELPKPGTAMHSHTLQRLQHDHVFLDASHARSERRTRWVVALTLVMMVAEIVAGTVFGSMALLADGWHMATHAGALGLAAAAYAYARRHAHDRRYTFGTGKVGDLAGFTSALVLAIVALLIAIESFRRLFAPNAIAFDEAIVVAAVGLVVNLVSAALLMGRAPGAQEDHGHAHHDHNLRAAYLHVLADALTSMLAIVALVLGRALGWTWLDAAVGLIGAAVILRWSAGLARSTAGVLLDATAEPSRERAIRAAIETDDARVSDLHVWCVGPGQFAVLLSIVAEQPLEAAQYRARLARFPELVHISVETHRCPEH